MMFDAAVPAWVFPGLALFAREHPTAPRGLLLMDGAAKGAAAEPAGEDPDIGLVMAVKNGDDEAFEKIVLKYQGPAFNIALRMLADREEAKDLAQEVFIKVYRSLRSFRSESRFSHWFYTVLVNSCRSRLKHLRRRGFYRDIPLDDPVALEDGAPPRQWPDRSPGAAELLEKKQTEELIQEKMKLVPDDFRDVLILRDVQGLAYEEIAAATGLNVGTVKSKLHRGRMIMKGLLTEAFGEER